MNSDNKKKLKYSLINNFFRQHKIDIIIIFIFLILPFLFFKDAFHLKDIIFGAEDSIRYYIPTRSLVLDTIKSGSLPLWDRYIFGGFPLLATPDIYTFYPPALILDLTFPIPLSYNLLVILQYSFSGIFMYFFLKEYELNRLSCFLGGLVFIFSGNMISHRSLSVYLNVFMWAPLIFLFLEKYRKTKRFEYLLFASLTLSISFLGGAQQVFIYLSITIVFYILYYSFIYDGGKNYYFLLSFVIFLFTILIGLIQLIPTLELTNNSFARSNVDYNYMTTDSYDGKLLPSLIFPYMFGCKHNAPNGIPSAFRWMGYSDSVNMIRYFGITTIPFALIGLTRKNKHIYFWIFTLITSFAFVFGKFNPIYKLFLYIPIINRFKIPTRIFFIFGFALAIIIAFGFNEFINLNKEKIKGRIIASISIICIIFSSFFIFYYLLRYTKFQTNILTFFSTTMNTENLLNNIQLKNFAIYVPLVFLLITLIFLIFSLFKKNNLMYIAIIVLIFLDLFFMGHFDENNRENDYFLNKNYHTTNKELDFLNNQNEPFRILVLEQDYDNLIFSPNRNIYYKQEQLLGYDPLILKDFSELFPIQGYGLISYEDGLKLLKNNNLISIYNTKYIVVPVVEDQKRYLEELEKYDLDKKSIILNNFKTNAETINATVNTQENNLILQGENNQLKLYKVFLKLKDNKDYLISLDIKGKNINNNVHFDFFGNNYDNAENEFYLKPENIPEDKYQNICRYINSSDIPENTETFFRIFTYSQGEINIKNLKIYEVPKTNNYDLVFKNEKIMILENLNYLPRFYLANNLYSISDKKLSFDYMWERNENYAYNHFNPKDQAIIESPVNIQKSFNNKNSKVNVLSYSNNIISLNTHTENETFLIFSDTNYPGWKAFIDGVEANIYNTNGILKGIYLPEGNHIIEFKYFPRCFKILLTISITTTTGLLIISITLIIKHRKKRN